MRWQDDLQFYSMHFMPYLHLPPDQLQQRPESQMERLLYDCPHIPVGSDGKLYRVVVATHPAGKTHVMRNEIA